METQTGTNGHELLSTNYCRRSVVSVKASVSFVSDAGVTDSVDDVVSSPVDISVYIR